MYLIWIIRYEYVEIKHSFAVFDTSYCLRETNGKYPNAEVC